jgi:hypothetical protein
MLKKVKVICRRGLGLSVAWGIWVSMLGVPATADDTIIGGIGGRLVPLNSKHIRLVRERVQVKLDPQGGLVECLFVFRNEGPPARVKMGFPQILGQAPLERFRCTVDGRPVRVHHQLVKKAGESETETVHPYQGWHWWWIQFGRHQTKTVINRYWAEASSDSLGNRWFDYVLKTGANWKGPIGQAEVEVDVGKMPASDLYAIKPAGFRRQGNKIRWTWRNFEPQQDLRIAWNPNPRLGVAAVVYEGKDLSLDLPAKRCLLQGWAYVPARRVAQALGMQCDEEEATRTLAFHRGKVDDPRRAIFQVGSLQARIRNLDGSEEIRLLPAPVFQFHGETMVPLRVLAEALNWGLEFTGGAKDFGNYRVQITHYERS